jgi:hypothetical protein
MPTELTTAQAEKVAELARQLGTGVALHEITGGTDVYVSAIGGGRQRFLISADGDASDVPEPPAADVGDASR